METNQQNTPQICWNRVTVTELKFTKNQWRTDRLLWKGAQGYGGGWLRRLRAVGSVLLSGSATQLTPAAPWQYIYMEEVISADEMEGKRRSNQQLIRKMVNSDICQDPDKQVMCTKATHTHKWTNTTTVRDAICQSQRRISATLSQNWHNLKSTWLKLDLSNSTQTVSVNSDSFRPDWRDIVTLVIVAASLWQVCAHSHTLTHAQTYNICCKKWMLALILALN